MEEESVSTGGLRIDSSILIAIVSAFVILTVGFSLLTDSLKLGFIIAMLLALVVGAAFMIWFFSRTVQRHDNAQGRDDYVQQVGPLMTMLVDRLRTLEEEATEERRELRARLDAATNAQAQPVYALPAPASRPAPIARAPRRDMAEPEPQGKHEMPPQIINITGDLIVEETARGDEARFGVQMQAGEKVVVRFSCGLVQHFLLTQYPTIRQDNWQRDDHQYGNTARLLQALGPVVPRGKGWVWNPDISRGEVEHWWNSVVRRRVFGGTLEAQTTPSPADVDADLM